MTFFHRIIEFIIHPVRFVHKYALLAGQSLSGIAAIPLMVFVYLSVLCSFFVVLQWIYASKYKKMVPYISVSCGSIMFFAFIEVIIDMGRWYTCTKTLCAAIIADIITSVICMLVCCFAFTFLKSMFCGSIKVRRR